MEKKLKFNIILSSLDFKNRLDYVIAKKIPFYSRSCIKNWILNGFVKINNKCVNKPSKKF